MGRTLDAVNKTVDEGISRGIIDERLHAAPISVMRTLAATIDDPSFPIINDRYDNVSIPTLLKYLQSLNLTAQVQAQPAKPAAKMDGLKGKFHAIA